MADDNRIFALVEEALCSGQTPEEVCADDPILLPEVRARLDECRRVDSMVEDMFPAAPPERILSARAQPGSPLPEIPGYEVLGILGRGGHGIVYRVRHLKLKRIAALKMLLTGEYASSTELARFMREAEAIAALQHPHIVQIYEIGEVDGRPYFTMEFVGGGNLAQKLGGVPQPAQYSVSVAQSLARAIHVAHIAGIVHRDLKPGNILLSTEATPKISDFGLARPFAEKDDITRDAARIGTPSYMAPEQIVGKPGTVGPAADIYALGATLYELLTGRPPFRAETATETERQVLSQEPASPSRLNARVPRDLEIICLKCLQKEPSRRYETAAALADDLQRFREGRPIQARPVGWAARAWRWSRRNPTGAALVATALILAMTAGAGGIRIVQQRAQRRAEAARNDADLHKAIDTELAQAVSFRKGFHFQQAGELLEEARQRLEPAGPDDLRRRVAQSRADLDLVEQLDAARFRGAMIVQGKFDPTQPEPFYASAFARAGLGKPGDDIAVVAARVQHSSVCAEIIDALDDWASITTDPARQKWLFEIARRTDPDPERDRLRQPDFWDAPGGVAQPIPELNPDKISPRMATALARLMQTRGVGAIAPLLAVQAREPQDFWLNFELGNALFRAHRYDEALGYTRAALALRPQSAAAHSAVAAVLLEMGRVDEAIDQLHIALDIDSNYAEAHFNLAEALRSQGKLDDAIAHFRQAIAENLKFTDAYIDLAVALQAANRLNEAIDILDKAIRIDPRNAKAHNNLATILRLQGRPDDAIAQLKEAVDLDPRYAVAQINLGDALWVSGRLDEAIEHIQQAAQLDSPEVDAQDLLCDHLYAAACVAIREALGEAVGKPRLDETARARLRLCALRWLRTSLKVLIELVESGRAQASSLNTWETEPILASVRDPGELAKLPEAERQQWTQLWAMVGAEIVADPLVRAREWAAHGDWAGAARSYARTLARRPVNDGHLGFEYAAVQLLSGNRPGYTAACARLLERGGKPGGPRAYHVARAGTLAGDGAPDVLLLARVADEELKANPTQFWALTEQGALAYRAGRFDVAASFFEQSLKADSHPGCAVVNWVWLAMADQCLGKTDEAQRWLAKAQRWLDQFRDGVPTNAETEYGLHLHNWLEANVLRREAEALIPSSSREQPDGG